MVYNKEISNLWNKDGDDVNDNVDDDGDDVDGDNLHSKLEHGRLTSPPPSWRLRTVLPSDHHYYKDDYNGYDDETIC